MLPGFALQIDTGEAEVVLDAIQQIERGDEIRHEADLVEAAFQEEAGERGITQIARTIKIIGALLVGSLQVLVVGGARAGKTAGESPKPFRVQTAADHAGLGLQAGHAAVAISKGMDPSQPVMGGCGCNESPDGKNVRAERAYGQSAMTYRSRRLCTVK